VPTHTHTHTHTPTFLYTVYTRARTNTHKNTLPCTHSLTHIHLSTYAAATTPGVGIKWSKKKRQINKMKMKKTRETYWFPSLCRFFFTYPSFPPYHRHQSDLLRRRSVGRFNGSVRLATRTQHWYRIIIIYKYLLVRCFDGCLLY